MKFLLWLIVAVLCWPIALIAILVYPVVWVVALPFRIVGISVSAVLELVKGLITLPGRLLSRGRR